MWTIYKNQKKNPKFKETGDSRFIYQNQLDKACFQHDMAYGELKDLTRRTVSHKILRDKAFNIAKNPKYYGYQRELASLVCKFVDKKTSGSGIKNEIISNKELVEDINKLLENSRKEKYTQLL